MALPDSPSQRSLQGVKGGFVWGTLALAMAAGYLTVRYQPRVGTWLGLGCAALGLLKNRRPARPPVAESPASPPLQTLAAAASEPGPQEPPPTVGALLLQVEPLPSVVEEAARGVVNGGHASCLLAEAPLLASEEAISVEDDGLWPSVGAAIPDAVELPELRES